MRGTIANQAPIAVSKPDQTLECASPTGANATLDGSGSNDADGNIQVMAWGLGDGLDKKKIIGDSAVLTTLAPCGTTRYTLQVMDRGFQLGLAQTNVTVQDTTPPVLTIAANPSCLWAPNHKLVVYELGKELAYSVADTCDPNPTVTIVGASSDQPDLGGGQGNFTPDILAGKKGLCLRSEREGTTIYGLHASSCGRLDGAGQGAGLGCDDVDWR